MAIARMPLILLFAAIARCTCEPKNIYSQSNVKRASQFGELLQPPPPPLSKIIPVPFHSGAERSQRQNDIGYNYQPPPPSPILQSNEFRFPAPFYKQYNFNFVPPPQPFTSTPSPSLFQKFSGWLFPSQQTSYDGGTSYNNIPSVKKDCNPCNLVPWIPVIRYNLDAKQVQLNLNPTYGPPSPTAFSPVQFRPQSQNVFHQQYFSTPVPHASYGPPTQLTDGNIAVFPSSTYGPPSPTHNIAVPSPNPLSSTYTVPSSSYKIPSSSYGVPLIQPSLSYNLPSTSYSQSSMPYTVPSSTYGLPSSAYNNPSSTTNPKISTFTTPAPSYEYPRPTTTSYESVTSNYHSKYQSGGAHSAKEEAIKAIEPASNLQLPNLSQPVGFKNSYGEPISNVYDLGITYPGSATAAESSKVKTQVLPNENFRYSLQNSSFALANPAPFSLNKGRNIHTLQPVALPNLSVSPLPPIFNARPFRPITPLSSSTNAPQTKNYVHQNVNNVKIAQSIPVAEYIHSVDYPTTVVQSPVIDVDNYKTTNQSKSYRYIPNGYVLDEIRDISSQASEDHISATKTNQDNSFESTGPEVDSDVYNTVVPNDLRQKPKFPYNHKPDFADLREVKDEDVDKYRTEENLQSIDSPLLYLKPSAPHKEFSDFIFAITTPVNNKKEYEMYDEISTTVSPQQSSFTSYWDENRSDYSESISAPTAAQEDANQPKIVQIIIPYTTDDHETFDSIESLEAQRHWQNNKYNEYQARKVPFITENYSDTSYRTELSISNTTELPVNTITENYDAEKLSTAAILNDLYDVKEPPFDIIKLQHNIDDWTEQEFAHHYRTSQKSISGNYAKQIPDEYLTTTNPTTDYVTETNNYNYEFYDHEGASSMHHSAIANEISNSTTKNFRQYKTIDRNRSKHKDGNIIPEDNQKLFIYTAASSFRGTTTTTPAPWGKIQTSISPLTKEKIYVVTSKPWKESLNATSDWYELGKFESKKTENDNNFAASEGEKFYKSFKFLNHSKFYDTSGDSVKPDSSYGFSKIWHQSINALESQPHLSLSWAEGFHQNVTTNLAESNTATPIAVT